MKAAKKSHSVYETLTDRDMKLLARHLSNMEFARKSGAPCKVCGRQCQLGEACPYWPNGRPPQRKRSSIAFLRALTAMLATSATD